LKKKVSFLSISKTILGILKDSNYKKYAILEPININQIINIDKWARETTLKKLFK
jgi:1-deoxy-D-xylulose 5-phosphate reductoisomerase